MQRELIINLIIVLICATGYMAMVIALFNAGHTSMGWDIPTVVLLSPFVMMIGIAITLIVWYIIDRQ